MRFVCGLAVVSWSSFSFAQQPLATPPPEVRDPPAKVELPPIPSFELPPEEPGFVSVQELRVNKAKHLDTTVRVKGYVTWIYDCVGAVAKPGETKAKTKKRVDEDPAQCERPKFYLGASPKESPLDGLWVVSVPRPPNKLEKERLPKEELKAWPKVPIVKLGAFVAVTGQFKLRSPHGERNSDGLVVFEAMAPAKPTPAKKPAAQPAPEPTPSPAPVSTPPAARPTDAATSSASIKLSNEATRAYAQKQYVDAIAKYQKAVATWPQNHVAWYGLAGAYIGQKYWTPARDAAAKAVEIAPDQSMYQLLYGYTLYEQALAAAREDQAKKEGRKPEEVTVDTSTINHEKALHYLALAVKLEPRLWRAHYYIGRIHRDASRGRPAAEALDAALRSAPLDPSPWIALIELYRRWRYTDEAIAVAKVATTTVPTSADLHYVLGMSYYDKGKHKEAIAAFAKALEVDPKYARALFQRGQTYFDKRDHAKARVDLEAFLQIAPPNLEFPKQQANRMLLDMPAKK